MNILFLSADRLNCVVPTGNERLEVILAQVGILFQKNATIGNLRPIKKQRMVGGLSAAY
jgi:hypothetical protein